MQVVASWCEPDTAVPVGTHVIPGDHGLASTVRRTARPVRIDDDAEATATSPSFVCEQGIRFAEESDACSTPSRRTPPARERRRPESNR